VQLQLTIEDAIECFGRETVAKWITRGMKIDHGVQVRQQERRPTAIDSIFNPEETSAYTKRMRDMTTLNVEVK
jgi:hypothetical protein